MLVMAWTITLSRCKAVYNANWDKLFGCFVCEENDERDIVKGKK